MFQYTKENILNKVEAGTFDVVDGKLIVDGLGEYVLANIVDQKIYKTVGQSGQVAKKTVTFTGLTAGKEYVLSFRVITPDQYLAEYASPNWQVFGKPIIVGFNYKDVASLVEAIKLAIPEGNKYFKVAAGTGTAVVLEATTKYMDFDKVAVELVEKKEDDTVPTVTVANTQERIAPFATKEWIIENLRFPTYPNIRYNSVGNVPTEALYDELAFTYAVPRVGLGGLSGVGQGLTAVTRHIFFVPHGSDLSKIASLLDDNAKDDEPMLDVETESEAEE